MTAKIKLNAASGGGSVSLQAPSSTTSNAAVELQLPVADGSADTFLKTDGSGALSFAAAGGGKVLKYETYTTTTATSTSGQTFVDTGLSGTIQPSAANSKILVIVNQFFRTTSSTQNTGTSVQVLEGSNVIVPSQTWDLYYFGGGGASCPC